MLHTTNSFAVQVSQSRTTNKGLKAEGVNGEEGRVKKVAKFVKKKLGLGSNNELPSNFPVVDLKQRRGSQPLPKGKADEMSQKYGSIDDVEERAYQILVDLGLVEETKGKNKKL
jgi:hypothetical protein